MFLYKGEKIKILKYDATLFVGDGCVGLRTSEVQSLEDGQTFYIFQYEIEHIPDKPEYQSLG